MRDHQDFEETILPNGIRVYTYIDSFPISCMELQLPVGSAHAIPANNFISGSPHFLEHTQLIRSELFPEPYSLDRALGLRAGNSNGATHAKATTHWIDTPAAEQEFGVKALINRIFHPLFNDDDLKIERSVVANERNQNKFYPGKNLASQYFFSQFIHDVSYPLDQIFGSDHDLEAMNLDYLVDMHRKITTSDQIVALAVGNHSFEDLKEELAKIPTQKSMFASEIKPSTWIRKDYHTASFPSVAQPRLEFVWIHSRPDYKEYRGICFLINALVNTTQGPLYREFREEKGWTYGLDATCVLREHNVIAGLSFPVNEIAQVQYIRENIADRIHKAVSNQQLIDDEITRQLGNQVYMFQSAGSIISTASSEFMQYGLIHTEAEHREAVRAMSEPSWRNHVFSTFFKESDMGSMCFLPE